MTQAIPQKPWKKISKRKSAQKVLKFLGGGGGGRPGLENIQIKLHFFLKGVTYYQDFFSVGATIRISLKMICVPYAFFLE